LSWEIPVAPHPVREKRHQTLCRLAGRVEASPLNCARNWPGEASNQRLQARKNAV
jgi:hypothetical protein